MRRLPCLSRELARHLLLLLRDWMHAAAGLIHAAMCGLAWVPNQRHLVMQQPVAEVGLRSAAVCLSCVPLTTRCRLEQTRPGRTMAVAGQQNLPGIC